VDITRRQLGRLAAVGTGAFLLPGLLSPGTAAAAALSAGKWGDQGDGTNVNPIVPADLSDWDCIRAGSKPQWEWYYQPRSGYWSLTDRPGYLRLKAFAPLSGDNLMKVGDTLTQRGLCATGGATVTVRLELAGLADGQHAGLSHYAATYAGLGVRRSGTTTAITLNVNGTLTNGPVVTQNAVWLRTTWDVNGVSQFSYSLDGSAFTSFGGTYQLTWGGYRGDRIGLYTYNPNGTGYVDVDSVQYTVAPTRSYKCVSVRSGKVAGVSGASTADGAAVPGFKGCLSGGQPHSHSRSTAR
jgi:hypothetical protein